MLGKVHGVVVQIGTETSTLDASGEVTATHDMGEVTLDQARAAAVQLTGDILQIPPMVSAVKVGGRRLHELAREGMAVPVLFGFIAPAGYLLIRAIERIQFAGFPPGLVRITLDTLQLASIATLFTMLASLVLAYSLRLRPGLLAAGSERIATLGYAIPGTVLGIGLLAPLGTADEMLARVVESVTGEPAGLLLLGTSVALIFAYCTRFMAVATGGLEAGFARITLTLDQAGRTLGATAGGVLRRIHLPLLRPALAAAALLVFVDCMKELPATLLLRPLNVETLATHVYAEAARGTYEDGAIAALLIIIAGLAPVILLSRVGTRHLSEGPAP